MRPDSVLQTLHAAGFEAYYVGGCVRDTLLGRPVHDWDVTTSALPEQTLSCFPGAIPTGLAHGTVTVLAGGQSVEVTTYRADGSYRDARHPESVHFVRTLAQDTARRDFTVNAMAMDCGGNILDFHGGRTDLARRLLRCVGDPERRFTEDALRMLRACRFAAQLDFTIEPRSWNALLRCAPLCEKLSRERLTAEVEKTLLSPHPEWLAAMIRAGLLTSCGLPEAPDLSRLSDLPARAELRWAGLGLLLPALDFDAFRLSARLTRFCRFARAHYAPGRSRLAWKQLIADHGADPAALLAALEQSPLVDEILASGECVSLHQLAVDGRDFPALHGPALGAVLHALLTHVLRFPEDNCRERLLSLAAQCPD